MQEIQPPPSAETEKKKPLVEIIGKLSDLAKERSETLQRLPLAREAIQSLLTKYKDVDGEVAASVTELVQSEMKQIKGEQPATGFDTLLQAETAQKIGAAIEGLREKFQVKSDKYTYRGDSEHTDDSIINSLRIWLKNKQLPAELRISTRDNNGSIAKGDAVSQSTAESKVALIQEMVQREYPGLLPAISVRSEPGVGNESPHVIVVALAVPEKQQKVAPTIEVTPISKQDQPLQEPGTDGADHEVAAQRQAVQVPPEPQAVAQEPVLQPEEITPKVELPQANSAEQAAKAAALEAEKRKAAIERAKAAEQERQRRLDAATAASMKLDSMTDPSFQDVQLAFAEIARQKVVLVIDDAIGPVLSLEENPDNFKNGDSIMPRDVLLSLDANIRAAINKEPPKLDLLRAALSLKTFNVIRRKLYDLNKGELPATASKEQKRDRLLAELKEVTQKVPLEPSAVFTILDKIAALGLTVPVYSGGESRQYNPADMKASMQRLLDNVTTNQFEEARSWLIKVTSSFGLRQALSNYIDTAEKAYVPPSEKKPGFFSSLFGKK